MQHGHQDNALTLTKQKSKWGVYNLPFLLIILANQYYTLMFTPNFAQINGEVPDPIDNQRVITH